MLAIDRLLKLKSYPLSEAQLELKRIQGMSKDEYYHWREFKKWEVVRFHFTYNELYKKIIGKTLPDRWDELPIIQKRDLQTNSEIRISKGLVKSDLHFGSTSGSSGIPLQFAKDKFCHSMTWSLILDRYQKVGIDSSQLQARFFGMPLNGKYYYKELVKDFLMNRFRFVVYNYSEESFNKFLNKFKNTKFRYIYGYSNSQLTFARFIQEKGICLKDICPSLECAIVTSEQCPPESMRLIEQAFGIPVYNEYGAAELEFIAMTDKSKKSWLSNETLLTEVLDDNYQHVQDEQEGKLIFTNLFNRAMPLIRYEVGDIGSVRIDKNQVQDELLTISGRLHDTVSLPSGKKASGFGLYYISKFLMVRLGYIQEYQVHQVAINHFKVYLVIEQEISADTHLAFREAFDKYLEPKLKIDLIKVEFIDRSKSGKLKSFISHLDV